MTKKIAIVSLGLLMFCLTASAAEFIAPQNRNDASVSTLEKDTHKNLYIAGATVTVNGKTNGDLFAAGGMVTVNGPVENDLFVGGGNLSLNAPVGGDLRIAGGNVSINSPIGSDLLAAGGNITVAQKASVAGDLVIAGGNISVDSEVKGYGKINGGNVTINGKIDGNLDIVANQQLTFGPASEVVGKITYHGTNPAIVKDGAKIGTIDFTQIKARGFAHSLGALIAISTLIKLLALLVAGFVLLYLFPVKISKLVTGTMSNTLTNFGIGFLALIASPIVAGLLFITVVGVYLGIILLLIYFLTLVMASIVMVFYTGRLVYGWYKKDAALNLKRDLVLGAIIALIVSLIPIIGWLAVFVLFLISLGAIVTQLRTENAQ